MVYIADTGNNRIIKVDLEFNQLTQTKSMSFERFKHPCGICLNKHNRQLYACDWQNKSIHVFDSVLNWQTFYKLDYSPWYIKMIENVACVRDNQYSALFFHNVNDFSILSKHLFHSGIIGSINNYFYEYVNETQIIYCYDNTGNLSETIQSIIDEQKSQVDCGSIIFYNSKSYLHRMLTRNCSLLIWHKIVF